MIKLRTGNPPHVRSRDTVRTVMIDVLIGLIPATIAAVIFFGWYALFLVVLGAIAGEVIEFFIMKYVRKQKDFVWDGSAAVTGVLLALNVGIGTPWWVFIIGLIFALVVAKHAFGGIGQNIFNPALAGRVFLLISFPTYMAGKVFLLPDAVTQATPLTMFSDAGHNIDVVWNSGVTYWDLFVGKVGGSLGETSVLALLIGFVYLVLRGRIKLVIPISYVGTTFVFALVGWISNPKLGDPLFHILSGGLMLGALFMATDMVTSPMTKKGQFIFGFGAGALTYIIRIFGAYPEGVSLSILIMNGLVPLIDNVTKPRIFGEVKE